LVAPSCVACALTLPTPCDLSQVSAAKALLAEAVAGAADLNAEVRVEGWMIPSVVGAKGANIQQLQRATGAELHVDRGKNVVAITGTNKVWCPYLVQGLVGGGVCRLAVLFSPRPPPPFPEHPRFVVTALLVGAAPPRRPRPGMGLEMRGIKTMRV
jgi:hypothetical protein